jgi:glycosyltransferase involved in cell wall biosynthesis
MNMRQIDPGEHLDLAIHVALDISAVHETSGGVLRYVTELARSLPAAGLVPTLIDQRHPRHDLPFETTSFEGGLRSYENISIESRLPRLLRIAPTSPPQRLIWEQTNLERNLRKMAAQQVLHSPHYTMPRSLGRPLSTTLAKVMTQTRSNTQSQTGSFARRRHDKRIGHVVTIHDLTFFSHPELHRPAKRQFFRSAICYAARHADVLVCVSNRTAEQLNHYVDVQVPIVVAEHGIDTVRFSPPTIATAVADAEAISRLGLDVLGGPDGRYILWLGAIAPHKNLGKALQAFSLLKESSEFSDLTFVVAGKSWPGAWEEISHLAHRSTRRIGFVTDSDAVALLRRASAFVYPSLEEGFGFPVLEALACGTSVVTTANSVMDELAAGNAIAVDAQSAQALADGLRLAIRQRHINADLRINRARSFTWERSAQLHVQAYRLALESIS